MQDPLTLLIMLMHAAISLPTEKVYVNNMAITKYKVAQIEDMVASKSPHRCNRVALALD